MFSLIILYGYMGLRNEVLRMKKYINGKYIEMTPEEVAEHEALAQEAQMPEPTAEERLEALEAAMLELIGVTPND